MYIVQGLAQGLTDTAGKAVTAAKDVALATYSAMQAANNAASDVIMNGVNPVITPVLNLDEVYKGVGDISSLMSNNSAINASGAINAKLNGSASGTSEATNAAAGAVTQVFNQNNYSPKALSRLEIYRQTKNLLWQKGLGEA
jgi:hypothetical protein